MVTQKYIEARVYLLEFEVKHQQKMTDRERGGELPSKLICIKQWLRLHNFLMKLNINNALNYS